MDLGSNFGSNFNGFGIDFGVIFMSYRTAADLPRHFGDPRRTTVSNRRTYSTMVQNGPDWSHGVSWAAWEGLWRSSEGAWGLLGRS